MIKCPKCGSTAQVRELGKEYNNQCLTEKFECGCGCQFHINYYWCNDTVYMVDIKIITEEGD